jgi:uncharacterized protein
MLGINWIEIPARDHARAVAFYSKLLDTQIEPGETQGMPYSFLPSGIGAISSSEHVSPSANGVTIYLHMGNDLSPALARVEEAGGRVIVSKSPLGPENFFAIIHDTEGNRIGLYSDH